MHHRQEHINQDKKGDKAQTKQYLSVFRNIWSSVFKYHTVEFDLSKKKNIRARMG